MRRGQPAPDWYHGEPDALPGYEFVIAEFWDLSTERQLGFAIGPIPSSKIREKRRELGLDPQASRTFTALIRSLDRAFRDWVEKERERNRKSHGRLPDQGGGRPGGRKVRYKGR